MLAVQNQRERYFQELESKNPADTSAMALTQGLLASGSVEIFNAYLPQISKLYVPVQKDFEYSHPFRVNYNIRYFNITRWVIDKEENSLEKLINVYDVLSDEDCNIALIFHRSCTAVEVYLAVTNNQNADNNIDADNYRRRLAEAIKGNFPGSILEPARGAIGIPHCLNNQKPYSVASVSNIPAEKSEKFISQTIEKLLDGMVPENSSQEYTLILLATPVQDIENRKLRLAELYSGLAPYASWQTNFTYMESDAQGSSAVFGVNIGASAGIQNGANQSLTGSHGVTDSEFTSQTDEESRSDKHSEEVHTSQSTEDTAMDSFQHDTMDSSSSRERNFSSETNEQFNSTEINAYLDGEASADVGLPKINLPILNQLDFSAHAKVEAGINNKNILENFKGNTHRHEQETSFSHQTADSLKHATMKKVSNTVDRTVRNTISKTTSQAITKTLGKAVTNTLAATAGTFQSINLGGNFGANFSRSSNVTATVGKNEGITQNFTNYTIRHALEVLEEQMKRYEQSTALGMWDFAAYVLSEDLNTANNAAHSYLALTQGETSYMTHASVNLWRGDMGEPSQDAKEICAYLRELRHPVFGLNPAITKEMPDFQVYPAMVTPAVGLSGKELAYSLNFPKKSVSGFPVFTCAEFGCNIVTYEETDKNALSFRLGNIFHMHHTEQTQVSLSGNSLCSHTFVTGSTGAGKSNTIYQMIEQAMGNQIPFLVIEPAKGEYKSMFGSEPDVSVYGTNPEISPVLRMNPFSFPKQIHVLEHIDRLTEIFNVCWPMYAAMPAVLKKAIEISYKDCGWNLTESVNSYGENLYPNFADVARNIRDIIDSSEYDSENKGAYKGSLLTRLQSLTTGINSLIFTADEITSSDLFDKNTIIDLSRVGSSETKSLMMGILIIKLQEHRMSQNQQNQPLKHLTVLEEAHHLLKRTSQEQSSESSNLLGKSVEMLANAIAEMRTYGEGFIIADQAPALMDMSVIRNTNTKIIMRLPDRTDRELVGLSANLNQNQIEELAKLPCGVGAVYQNEWIQPVLCKIGKVKPAVKAYVYQKPEKQPVQNFSAYRMEIAELLSNCTALEREVILKDISPKLKILKLDASVQVKILNLLSHPKEEPSMTAFAPVMKALFPDIYSVLQQVYSETKNPREWTLSAEQLLRMTYPQHLKAQVRRDIIQAVITEYLQNEIRNLSYLEEWYKNGGLQ